LLINFLLFLNTPIRPLPRKNVTAEWPQLVVQGVFIGKARDLVGENFKKYLQKVNLYLPNGVKAEKLKRSALNKACLAG